MKAPDWLEGFAGAVVVSDRKGRIIYMNQAARLNFRKEGGERLLGSSLFDCHNASSCAMIRSMLSSGISHAYTVQNKTGSRLVAQYPWYEGDEIGGVIEITFPCSVPLSHRDRRS